jgi:signal transduction histidine kinase
VVAGVGLRDPEGELSVRIRPGEGLTALAAGTRRPVTSPDVTRDPRFLNQPWAVAEGLVSCIVVPLIVGERITGALAVYTRVPHDFSDDEVDLLRSFAAQAAIAIENARLYQEIRQHAATLEQRVQERTRELEAANLSLLLASQHKSEFLANMSHDIRTPLNSIIGFSELLKQQGVGPLTEKQARYIGHIHNSGKHLHALVNDILDLSKVEAGRLELHCERIALPAFLEDALALVRSPAMKKQIALSLEAPADLPPVEADPVRLRQILFNLLSNAIKFTPDGGLITVAARRVNWSNGQIVDSSRPIDQSTSRPIDCLEIRVTDTGIGIRPEDLGKLFREFTQLDTPAARQGDGTGLGLALCKRLVELHGGRIWASSAGEGKGSTFTVVLPFAGPAT